MTPEEFYQSQVKQHNENMKQTRTKIPGEVTRVRNAATGEIKSIDTEKELLTQIAYCAEGMFDCEQNQNLGDAKDWKRQLKIATDKYYNHLFDKTGEQH